MVHRRTVRHAADIDYAPFRYDTVDYTVGAEAKLEITDGKPMQRLTTWKNWVVREFV